MGEAMTDKQFQKLSNQQRADVLGLRSHDDGRGEFRVGETVWYKPRGSRKWRQGKVTYSTVNWSRGPRAYSTAFVRVDWNLASIVLREPPKGMCEHGYEPALFARQPHPCPRCRRLVNAT